MKKSIITLVLVAGLINISFSQELKPLKKEKYGAALKIYPGNMAWSEFLLGLEGALSRKNSIILNAGGTVSGEGSNVYPWDARGIWGLRGELQFRRYVTGKNILNGLYAGPFAYYRFIRMSQTEQIVDPFTGLITETEKSVRAFTTGGGVLVGYQLVISNMLTVDGYLGGGLKYSYDNIPDSFDPWGFNNNGIFGFRTTGINPHAGLSIGLTL